MRLHGHLMSACWAALGLWGTLGASQALAAPDGPKPAMTGQTRPRVGLVLGGGGARGAAHIGVLEVLEKLHVPVDCVAGTSMGGLVAGAYAGGLSSAVMRDALAKADWRDMFQDNPDFSELSYRSKKLEQRFLPGSEMGIGENGVQYQGGVIAGQKIKLFFNQLVRSDLGERHIEDLPLPVTIVATDIGTGEKVAFRQGRLTTVMRASMAVPGLMAPVDYQGRKLVDGGLVDNVPIREVRESCHADMVIAVNVGSPPLKPEQVGSLLTVSAQMVAILTEQNVSLSLATLQAQDIYIKPDLDGISAADFERHAETAERGRKAAEAVADRLRPYAVSEAEYASWWAKIEATGTQALRVDEIQVTGLQWVNPVAVERHISQRLGEPLDTQRLNRDLLRAYGDGYYDSVDYTLLNGRERNILRVMPVEKPWGQDYLRFAVNLETTLEHGSSYSLRAAYQKTWLNSLGGEMIAGVEVGTQTRLGVDFYQPLDERQRFFAETSLKHGIYHLDLYQDNHQVAEYRVKDTSASLAIGANVARLGQARLGRRETSRGSELETGTLWLDNASTNFGGWFGGLDFDQMDRIYFPTKGWGGKFDYFVSDDKGYSKLGADVRAVYPLGSVVLAGRFAYVGSPRGVLPYYDVAALGGLLNLSAFARGQLLGDDTRFAQVRGEQIIGQLPLGLRGDMRVGLALEAGKVGQPYSETKRSGWLDSKMLYLGGETPLGSVYLGYAWSSAKVSNLYLFIGTP